MTAIYHQSPNVVSSPLDGGAALLDLGSSTYFSLNAVGALAWDAIKDGATPDEIVSAVTERYAISEDQGRSDIMALLAALEAKGLARSENAGV